MTAQDLMTPEPVTVSTTTTVAEAWDVMREQGIRHLPVGDGAAAGIAPAFVVCRGCTTRREQA